MAFVSLAPARAVTASRSARSWQPGARSRAGCFDGYRVILVAEGEEAAANTIRFNDLVLMPAGFPRTADRLAAAGYDLRQIGNSECAKLDGGMSCLSLRFTPRA